MKAVGGSTRNIRTVWSIATQPYSGAHFAVFPQELAERCIKAGTSERGVCPMCGAAWERDQVVEPSAAWQQKGYTEACGARNDGDRPGSCLGRKVTNKGWCPTCAHDADPVPATVLDPFAGSGTTLYVARKLGRNSVGLELNEEYRALIDDRLKQGVLL